MCPPKNSSSYHSILDQGFLSPQTLSQRLKEYQNVDIDPEERIALETEILCFDYHIQNGVLVPLHEQRNRDGVVIFNYPDLKSFSGKQWEHIESRLKAEQNPFLSARYAHVLWMRDKHNKYAWQAIKAYKSLTDQYLASVSHGEERYYLFCETVSCYHYLCLVTKQETEACEKNLLIWLKSDAIPVSWKGRIMELIKGSTFIKPTNLIGLTDYMLSQIKVQKFGYTQTKDLLESLLLLAQKEKCRQEEVFDLLGENELRLASERENDHTGMIPNLACKRAVNYFKKAGNKEKMQEALNKYVSNKRNVKLEVVSAEDSGEDVQAWHQQLNNLVAFLLSEDPMRPFLFLATNKNLLPKEMSDAEALEQLKGHIRFMLSVVAFDNNNNSKSLSQEGKIAAHKFNYYSLHLQMGAIELINRLFSQGIKMGFISLQSYNEYFQTTWLAETLEGISTDSDPVKYSWIELLEPGLKELFCQLEADMQGVEQNSNYVLAVDSLTIKLEGIIRDFAMLASFSVTKIKEDESLEMNLEELLSEPNINALFDSDDVLLWRIVLTKRGWNQRNNIAHAFYKRKDYTRTRALLLLLCLYRLSKYQISKIDISGRF